MKVQLQRFRLIGSGSMLLLLADVAQATNGYFTAGAGIE